MSLFVIRHAHALSSAEDSERPLSKKGRGQIRSVTAFLKARGALQCTEVWHSPLARSLETAQLFVKRLELRAKLVEVNGLEGDADPSAIAGRLKGRRQSLAIIGHEPHLSALASLLVAGAKTPSRFMLKKCAVVALESIKGQWTVRWQISPEILKD